MHLEHVTDEQWAKIAPFLPLERTGDRGRPLADNRGCLEGILWVLRSGARWKDLPDAYPSPATCWRRLQRWERAGLWLKMWQAYIGQLDAQGIIDWEESFMDASFAPARKGGRSSVKHVKERGRSGWWWRTVRAYQSASTLRLRTLTKALSRSERSRVYGALLQAGGGLVPGSNG